MNMRIAGRGGIGMRGASSMRGTGSFRGGAATASPRRVASASEARANYHRRLEDLVSRAADAFRDIVKCAEITDHASSTRAEFQTGVDAAALAQAMEGLLRLISELKVAAVVQDVSSTERENAEVRSLLSQHPMEATAELTKLKDTVLTALTELEAHYYESNCRVPASQGEALSANQIEE